MFYQTGEIGGEFQESITLQLDLNNSRIVVVGWVYQREREGDLSCSRRIPESFWMQVQLNFIGIYKLT